MENGDGYKTLLMDYIKDNYITTPDKCIELSVIEFLKCYADYSGLETYTEWSMTYYKNTDKKYCEYIYNDVKKPKKYPKKDYLLSLAKVYDAECNLAEYYTDDDCYIRFKEKFEEYHFKCLDTFYKIETRYIDNTSYKTLNAFTESQFKTVYRNVYYTLDKTEKFIERWLDDPNIRSYVKVDFLPNGEESGVFNTWELIETEEYEIKDNTVSTENLHKLIRRLCENTDEGYSFMMNYLAHLIHTPERKPEVGIFFSSAQGSGKDTLIKLIEKLINPVCVAFENDPENIFGKFNKSARTNKLVVVLQEADNIKQYNSKIKDLITCKTATLGEKNIRSTVMRDYTRLIVLSNNENIIKIEPDDRRWVMFKCYNFFIDPDPEFFNNLHNDIDNPDVIQKFREELLSLNIDIDYNFQRNRPITEFYSTMKSANIPAIIRFMHQIIMPENCDKYPANSLCDYYNDYLKEQFETTTKTNSKSFGIQIKKYFYINNIWYGIEPFRTNTIRGYKIDKDTVKTFIEDKYNYIGDD